MAAAPTSWTTPPAAKDQRTLSAVASTPAASAPKTMTPRVKMLTVTLTRPRKVVRRESLLHGPGGRPLEPCGDSVQKPQ